MRVSLFEVEAEGAIGARECVGVREALALGGTGPPSKSCCVPTGFVFESG